jgi:phosphatidate cytidylyltransferase
MSAVGVGAISALGLRLDREMGKLSENGALIVAVLYVGVPLGLLVRIWQQEDGPFYLLFTLIIIWTGDTAGYYIGKNFGKHKSSPRISPNKTWEGTVASFVAALLVATIAAFYFWGGNQPAELIVLAGLLNVAGQLGDLAESGLKRRAGVKDSSNLIPGHGGVLDRIDALLFAAPVLWYYWLWKTN